MHQRVHRSIQTQDPRDQTVTGFFEFTAAVFRSLNSGISTRTRKGILRYPGGNFCRSRAGNELEISLTVSHGIARVPGPALAGFYVTRANYFARAQPEGAPGHVRSRHPGITLEE